MHFVLEISLKGPWNFIRYEKIGPLRRLRILFIGVAFVNMTYARFINDLVKASMEKLNNV